MIIKTIIGDIQKVIYGKVNNESIEKVKKHFEDKGYIVQKTDINTPYCDLIATSLDKKYAILVRNDNIHHCPNITSIQRNGLINYSRDSNYQPLIINCNKDDIIFYEVSLKIKKK